VEINVVVFGGQAGLPTRAHPEDAALDLTSNQEVTLAAAGGRAVIGTGLKVAIPAGKVGLILPRSGLAADHGITVLNAPGVIDPGFAGELRVVLINLDPTSEYLVSAGDRIAQLLVTDIHPVTVRQASRLDDSARGSRGFGSSGI
jgi:dUTP pyrophosphatase